MIKCKMKDEIYQDLKIKYKEVSSKIVKSTRKEKLQYYNKRLEKCDKVKDYWKELKSICKKDTKQNNHEIKIINEKNEITNNPQEVTQILNKHFAEVANNEIEKNPLFKTKYKTKYTSASEKTVLKSFGCPEITIFEFYIALKKLSNKNSSGSDKITAKEIKENWEELGVPITIIFNLSLQEGKFPESLKETIIIPIPKVQGSNQPGDYRPISILSTLSQIFEIIIQKRMLSYLMKQNYFSKNQFGFLPQRNTTGALSSHFTQITNNLENKKHTMGLYLDIAKAFDTVNHEILLNKLYKAGFRGTFWDWLKSYLEGRVIRVQYRKHTSD